MEIKRLFVNVCSNDLEVSRDFYQSLFSFKVNYTSDWFIHLVSESGQFELGIILQGHDIVPSSVSGGNPSNYLTFVVDDVGAVYAKAISMEYDVVEAPAATPYGQKRMVIRTPEGTICDVSSPIKNPV